MIGVAKIACDPSAEDIRMWAFEQVAQRSPMNRADSIFEAVRTAALLADWIRLGQVPIQLAAPPCDGGISSAASPSEPEPPPSLPFRVDPRQVQELAPVVAEGKVSGNVAFPEGAA